MPEMKKTSLPLGDLKLATEVFQFRMAKHSGLYSEDHINKLVRSLKTHGYHLPPLTVFYIDGEYYIIDGHHRLEAYTRCANTAPELVEAIPVHEFRGSFQEALQAAAEANTHDNLNMSLTEKRNTAWRLTLDSPRKRGDSKAISKSADVSKNIPKTYAKMQDELRAEGEDAATYTVQEAYNRKRAVPEYTEGWEDTQASHMASKIRKAAGPQLRANPAITAKALLEVLGESVSLTVVSNMAYELDIPIIDPEREDLPF